MRSLLENLEDAIAVSRDPVQRAELVAEKACYLARTGDVDASIELARVIRKDFGDGRSARVSIRLMLADGLAAYFGSVGDDAHNRIFRATELSRALRIDDLTALCAAWLAHIELYRRKYDRFIDLINEAITKGQQDDGHLWSRLGIVLADAYLYVGDLESAQHWYDFAHRHITLIGDRAALGALMHNRSAFGLALIRVRRFVDAEEAAGSARQFDLGINSSDVYNRVVNIRSLAHLSDLSLAWSKMLQSDFVGALSLLDGVQARIDESENRAVKTSVLADRALCLAHLGRNEEAGALLENALDGVHQLLDPDDQVIFYGSCLNAYDVLGIDDRPMELLDLFQRAKQAYKSDVQSLKEGMHRISSKRTQVDQSSANRVGRS